MAHENSAFNVVSLGARDYYQVAIALNNAGLLHKLITDFYCPNLLRSKVKKRYAMDLSANKTISLYFFSLLQILLRGNGPKRAIDFVFGFLAGAFTYATTNKAIVYSYYLEGFLGFYRIFYLKPKVLICFQVHPTPWFINKIIEDDDKYFSVYCKINFKKDIESKYSHKDIERYKKSLIQVDRVFCASSVTARSIFIDSLSQIPYDVIPYGSKLNITESIKLIGFREKSNEKIKLLSVCQISQRKGMHWAFKAMGELNCSDKFEWLVVSNNLDESIVKFAPINVRIIPSVGDMELANLMEQADLFVMPSLIEGFGLVYIESLSVGTPILYTKNTGPHDFIIQGVHGIEVKVSSIEDLKCAFENISNGLIDLSAMRKDCKKIASEINWSNFRAGIVNSVTSLENDMKQGCS